MYEMKQRPQPSLTLFMVLSKLMHIIHMAEVLDVLANKVRVGVVVGINPTETKHSYFRGVCIL